MAVENNVFNNFGRNLTTFEDKFKTPPYFINSSVNTTSPINTPPKDIFVKTGVAQATEDNKPSFKQKWLNKENLIIGGSGLALSAVIATVAAIRGKGVRRALATAQQTIASQAEQLTGNTKVIDGLKGELEKLSASVKEMNLPKKEFVQRYTEMIKDAVLGYDPLKVPDKGMKKATERYYRTKFTFTDIKPLKAVKTAISGFLKTDDLKETLSKKGKIELALPMTTDVKPVFSEKALIGSKKIPNLGEAVFTDMKLNYGKRINWSEEKIARDIMQNFYDGHGNTLDGVKVLVEKLPDGQHKIKISGLATFDYENLQYLGSGSKDVNLFNAGGFGEGSKIVVANLLGKNDAQSVRFGCADWELLYDSAEGIMRRTLKKVNTPIQGNFIEFTTPNKKMAEAMIDSINYFRHSKNPDFTDLTFDSTHFGFKILKEDEKGNVYLTQRFEYGQAGQWNEGADNLRIIYKSKPDAKEYKRILSKPLPKDRDRTFLGGEDIENLTRYFAGKMSDEELVQTVVTTKHLWSKLAKEKEPSAMNHFLKSIVEEMRDRGVIIDFGEAKYAAIDSYANDVVKGAMKQYGYTPCPIYLSDAGMDSAVEIFKRMSIHTPLAPTTKEIKKLKLLEEGVKLIKADIDEALKAHLAKPVIKINPEIKKEDLIDFIRNSEDSISEFKALHSKYPQKFSYYKAEALTDKEFQAIKQETEEIIKNKFRSYSQNIKDGNLRYEIYKMTEDNFCAQKIFGETATGEYLKTYKDFSLINDNDVTQPRFIFDRNSELAKDTLGEAIIEKTGDKKAYLGHWVDREYFKGASFNDALATWLHEICHKSGGDGTSEFTYTLTDLIKVLVNSNTKNNTKVKLAALEDVYSQIGQ